MRATYSESALARYRDSVTAMMEAGEPFGSVEDAIDEAANLTEDAKAALWLLAFSLQQRGEQARSHVAAAG